jgi:rubrerythrin
MARKVVKKVIKSVLKGKWVCKKCHKPTEQKDKICMVCRTDETIIKGFTGRKKPKAAASKKAAAKEGGIRSPDLCDALSRGLDLETEGMEFYLGCAGNTANKGGKDMFDFLAREEKLHYDKISELFRSHDEEAYLAYVEAKGLTSGVFEAKGPGANLDEKADALDALNAGIKAENNSIRLYERLSEEAPTEDIRSLFMRLVGEEKNHKNILESEIEFVTKTGDFKDFRAVTM